MAWSGVERRVFISHYKGDREAVDEFINKFSTEGNVFTPYVLGANENDDFINSTDTDYVMSQIRKKYMQDSTVTIVLLGNCTHGRRYVDWEIKTSLRKGEYTPNGLLGIVLPATQIDINSLECLPHLPPRLAENYSAEDDCYAIIKDYPRTKDQLGSWIDEAYNARGSKEKLELIKNSNNMMKYNRICKVCDETH